MANDGKRNRLVPWVIGIIILLIADIRIGYRMVATDCPAPGFAEFLVLVVVPGVYLVLMYMTLTSQNGGARGT